MSFDKKTIYHSQLVREGPIKVKITGEPQLSKYRKDGKDSYFIGLKVRGDDHLLVLENRDVKEAMTGWRDRYVTLDARGSREDATMDVIDETDDRGGDRGEDRGERREPERPRGGERHSERETRREPERTTTRRAEPSDTVKMQQAKQTMIRAGYAYGVCLKAANHAIETSGVPVQPEHLQAATASLFIYMDRQGLIDLMGRATLEKEKPREPDPEPEPEPDLTEEEAWRNRGGKEDPDNVPY